VVSDRLRHSPAVLFWVVGAVLLIACAWRRVKKDYQGLLA